MVSMRLLFIDAGFPGPGIQSAPVMTTCVQENCYEFATSLAVPAAQFAYAHGIVRFAKDLSGVIPLPMSLLPWRADAGFVRESREVTPLYNTLYARVSEQREFLAEALGAARGVDPFVSRLFDCLPAVLPDKPRFFINRNDCMPHVQGSEVIPKQVEMNLMAAALGAVSAKVNRMHRYLYAETDLAPSIWVNEAGEDLVQSFLDVWGLVGAKGSVILWIVDPLEPNIFDMRATESRLVIDHGLPIARCSMDELGSEGSIQNGDLYFRGRKVAVAYFRVGYAPTHYTTPACWKARELIEASSAVSVPSVTVQLANMKKLQHTLSDPATLRRFVTDAEARRLERTFVKFARLEDEIEWRGQRGKARDLAVAFPDDWVMKPHREGGANNYFADDMVAELQKLSAHESEAYILMEMIKQEPFRAVRLVHGEVEDGPCFTELGVFGIYLAPGAGAEPVVNREGGYLLRTKNVANREGLVLGGFSFMDSVAV